jgi:DNA repair protein RecN (Recombination protein N)
MLRRLALRDFVLVRELDLDLGTGFSALTGETGAGKSILIEALQLALGSRAESLVVREGAARAEIVAEFDVNAAVQSWLLDAGFEPEYETGLANPAPHGALMLRRVVDAQAAKSRAWINGSPATATQLRELGEMLLDIHGQHAWQSLARSASVRSLLDTYAKQNTKALNALWTQWRQACRTLEEAQNAQASLQRERERLAWQIGEVDKLKPGEAEWDDLNAQHLRLSNAQSLLQAVQVALTALQDGDAEGAQAAQSAMSLITQASQSLQEQEHIEPEFAGLNSILASAQAQLEDVAHSLHGWLRKTELEPERLTELDERLSLWVSLARRFKCTPSDLPQTWTSWQTELAELDAASDLAALERQVQSTREALMREAQAISAARHRAAPVLAQAVSEAMQNLGMAGGRLEVALHSLEEPTAGGLEEVEFLVAGHAGSTPRPIAKVASGGELSRIALAIAVCTSLNAQDSNSADTLIFDEVDSGIGGAVAETVGRLMQQLGQSRQVLAVTHLPQVAAKAHAHLLVAKTSSSQGTHSQVTAIQGPEREREIARMLGGEQITPASLAHAREMLTP